jgi:hypothetical protein
VIEWAEQNRDRHKLRVRSACTLALLCHSADLGALYGQPGASFWVYPSYIGFPMFTEQINQSLSKQDFQEIKQAIATIQAKMPFLITLSASDRKRLCKMGDKRFSFVKNSLLAAQNNPNILPASFSVEAFQNDYQLALQLSELLIQLQQLEEQVNDTAMALGSDAMNHSLTVYDYVKTAAKKTPGLKSVAEQLGALFKAIRNRISTEPGANAGSN